MRISRGLSFGSLIVLLGIFYVAADDGISSVSEEKTAQIPPAPPLPEIKKKISKHTIEREEPQRVETPHRVLILLDYTFNESSECGAVTFLLKTALIQKACPIIVPLNALYNVLDVCNIAKKGQPEAVSSTQMPTVDALIPWSDWQLFKQKENGLYLLCPYTGKKLSEQGFNEELISGPLDVSAELQDMRKKSEEQWKPLRKIFEKDKAAFVKLEKEGKMPWNISTVMDFFKKSKRMTEPWHIAMFFHSALFGEPGVDFEYDSLKAFLTFLHKDLVTEFFFYKACFSGGENLEEVKKFLVTLAKKSRPSFIVAVGALAEAETTSTHSRVSKENNEWRVISDINLGVFFDKLQELFTRGSSKLLKEALSAITTVHDSVYNIPQVIFPGNVEFSAIEVDKTVLLLNNVVIKGHEIQGNKLVLVGKNIKALIVRVSDITVPVKLETLPQFVSILPGMATHTFSEINASEFRLSDFIVKLFEDVAIEVRKKFIIKTLRCQNYEQSGIGSAVGQASKEVITLSDVVITVGEMKGEKHEPVRLSFERIEGGKPVYYVGQMSGTAKGFLRMVHSNTKIHKVFYEFSRDEVLHNLKKLFEEDGRIAQDINVLDSAGNTPLCYVIKKYAAEKVLNKELITYLRNHGASLAVSCGSGNSPLREAITQILFHEGEFPDLFVSASAEDVNAVAVDGSTLAHFIITNARYCETLECKRHLIDLLKILRDKGANFSIRDKKGQTPAELAKSLPEDLRKKILPLLELGT